MAIWYQMPKGVEHRSFRVSDSLVAVHPDQMPKDVEHKAETKAKRRATPAPTHTDSPLKTYSRFHPLRQCHQVEKIGGVPN